MEGCEAEGISVMAAWTIDDVVPIVASWTALGAVGWWVLRQNAPKNVRPARIALAVVCGAFAAIAGVLSVLMVVGEMLWGQPHGPSPLWMGLFGLPLAMAAALIARWLLGLPKT
jgi:hypothetical protein